MVEILQRKVCRQCLVEIQQIIVEFQGNERKSWRNVDGSPHYYYEDGKFIHTPTQYGVIMEFLKRQQQEIKLIRSSLVDIYKILDNYKSTDMVRNL